MCMRHHKHDRHHETTMMSNYDKTLQDTMEHNMSHHKTSWNSIHESHHKTPHHTAWNIMRHNDTHHSACVHREGTSQSPYFPFVSVSEALSHGSYHKTVRVSFECFMSAYVVRWCALSAWETGERMGGHGPLIRPPHPGSASGIQERPGNKATAWVY